MGPPTWAEIVEEHSARVYRLAYRLTGDVHDAEDLTHDVFVRVFRSLDGYTPGTFEGWLHPDHHQPLPRPRPPQAAHPLRRADRRVRRTAAQRLADPRAGRPRPPPRRRHPAGPRRPATAVPGGGRPVRHRRVDLRGGRRGPRHQARHRPLPHPPRPLAPAREPEPPRAHPVDPHREPSPRRLRLPAGPPGHRHPLRSAPSRQGMIYSHELSAPR